MDQTVQGSNESFSAATKGFKRHQGPHVQRLVLNSY